MTQFYEVYALHVDVDEDGAPVNSFIGAHTSHESASQEAAQFSGLTAIIPLRPLFEPGHIVMTRGAEALQDQGVFLYPYIRRHLKGDDGDLDEEDKQANVEAIEYEGRILSAYETPLGKLWIITEWDRSVTTLLLPSEY